MSIMFFDVDQKLFDVQFSGFVSYLVVVMLKGRICLTYTAACLGLFALMEIQLLHLHSNELLRASAVL